MDFKATIGAAVGAVALISAGYALYDGLVTEAEAAQRDAKVDAQLIQLRIDGMERELWQLRREQAKAGPAEAELLQQQIDKLERKISCVQAGRSAC